MEKFVELHSEIKDREADLQRCFKILHRYGNKAAMTKSQRSVVVSYLNFYEELASAIPHKEFGTYEAKFLALLREFFHEVFGEKWLYNNGDFVKTLTKLGINQ